MKKLWKDNGGYALIYVLIVVLVLCAVAVSVCTAALKNYQAQEESVRQTRQLYQAEGEIEKIRGAGGGRKLLAGFRGIRLGR